MAFGMTIKTTAGEVAVADAKTARLKHSFSSTAASGTFYADNFDISKGFYVITGGGVTSSGSLLISFTHTWNQSSHAFSWAGGDSSALRA